jgi:hypothetical protein
MARALAWLRLLSLPCPGRRWAKQAGTRHVLAMRHLDDHGDIHLPEGFDVFAVRAAAAWSCGCAAASGGVAEAQR